jgi:hypothetical protein
LLVGGEPSAAKTGDARKSAHPATLVVTPIPGVCDTASFTTVFSDLTDPRARRAEIAFMQGAILACSREINDAIAHAPAPTPTPYWIPAVAAPAPIPTESPVCLDPPRVTLATDRIALYALLARCVAYRTYLNDLPTPEPTESPLSRIASRPTFYVFATGAVDTSAASVLIRAVVERLNRARRAAEHVSPPAADEDALGTLWVAGRADWTETSSFAAQCQLDPNTRGALIIQTSIPETSKRNYLLITANFSDVSASVEVLGCGPEDHNPAVSPLSLWSQQTLTGKAHQDTFTLGTLASLTTLLALAPGTTTVTRGQSTTTITQKDAATPIYTGTILSTLQADNLNVPAQNASVGLEVASERFASDTMRRLAFFCNEPAIKGLAADGDPSAIPAPPPEHRTLIYKAASEYMADCSLFANFQI